MKQFSKSKAISKLKTKNNNKRNIKITSIVLAIILLIGAIIYFSFARYESNKDFALINAKVGEYGDVVIAAVVDGQSQSSFPDKATYKLQSVECKDSDNNIITSMYDTNTWGMYIPEINGKTKCVYTFTTSEVEEHTLNPTTATGDSYTGSSGSLSENTLTESTQLNLNDYMQNDQYQFNLGGGEQVTFPSGFYSSPINVSNGSSKGGASLGYKFIINAGANNTTATSGSWTADKDYNNVRFFIIAGTGSYNVQVTVAGTNVPIAQNVTGTGYTKAGNGHITEVVESIKAGDVIYARTYGANDGQGFASRVDCRVTMFYVE